MIGFISPAASLEKRLACRCQLTVCFADKFATAAIGAALNCSLHLALAKEISFAIRFAQLPMQLQEAPHLARFPETNKWKKGTPPGQVSCTPGLKIATLATRLRCPVPSEAGFGGSDFDAAARADACTL